MSVLEAFGVGAALGVANALHCIGMCGVFAMYAARSGGFASYFAGKTMTYLFLGAVAGWLGARTLGEGTTARIVVGSVAGGMIVVSAAMTLGAWPAAARAQGALWRYVSPLVRQVQGAARAGGPFAIGALSGALPCGVSYLAALQGGSLGNPPLAMLVMAGFGLGTMPALVGAGFFGRGVLSQIPVQRVRWIGGIVLLGTGAFTMWRALGPLFHEAGAACCH